MMNLCNDLFVIIVAYLIGSIPVGILVAQACGIYNLQERGSGNTGATNVGRALGSFYFLLVLFLDFAKSFFYLKLLLFLGYSPPTLMWAAAFLLIGNCFSIFLNFKGGKGVATSLGVLVFLEPSWLFFILPGWVGGFLIFRRVGLASCCGALILLFLSFLTYWPDPGLAGVGIIIALVILIRHSSNIKSYCRG